MNISTSEIMPKKVRGKNLGFFNHRNYIKKSTWKQCGFSISEITSKKYVEVTRKFFEIWSLTYRRNIDVISTLIQRGVLVGIIPAPIFSKIVITFSAAILSRISFLKRFGDLIELFHFGMTGVSLSFNNGESLRESDIKIAGTDFDSSCGGKSNSSNSVSTSSLLT